MNRVVTKSFHFGEEPDTADDDDISDLCDDKTYSNR